MTSRAMRLLMLFSMLAVWLAAAPVGAAVVLHYDLAALATEADEVVHARVVSQASYWDDQVIMTEVTLEVLECLKGEHAAGDRVVVLQQGGVVGGLAMVVPGMPTFADDEEVVLFLEASSVAHATLVMGLAQGKFSVVADPSSGERLVHRDLTGLSRVAVGPHGVAPFDPSATLGPDALERVGAAALLDMPIAAQIELGPVTAPYDRFMDALRTELGEVAP